MALLSAQPRTGRVLAFLAGAWLLCTPRLDAQAVRASETQVKAVFLLNFAQFVDWPAETGADSQAPLVIGILGDDPFDGFLDEAVRGEQLRTRPVVVRRYRRLEDIKACDILFISESESDRVPEILASVKNRPILTVSDVTDFAQRGGIIRFVTAKARVRLEINPDAAQAARLTLSSKLLRLADLVTAHGTP
jgi:YfiR/HmsC-like